MSADVAIGAPQAAARIRKARQDPAWVRWGLTSLAVLVVGVLIVVPVVNIFVEALREVFGQRDTALLIRLVVFGRDGKRFGLWVELMASRLAVPVDSVGLPFGSIHILTV